MNPVNGCKCLHSVGCFGSLHFVRKVNEPAMDVFSDNDLREVGYL